ncbi:phenylalanine--tRNA ligase beta subunit-related protein [endosymbiont GvMRE of Glomus versiforme]|uniref:phenylalanine--tRNA ligase beta subunit-related protein n=1 Tax=endosymbiont GvMRE of Glomus versiforme TaxID=2039283 RepID=UPI000EEFB976|nr:phenylalanine--tRNA ligase beta subunit-related protein [endosymbiont GvMRE of Glomus versiforme]RHZ37317.1 Phenylalanine--tRNA ligase beta subunit [endosymbiont GvMRE of Glomus versiforme]
MYIPWNWLKSHLIFPDNSQPQKIVEKLTELGLETEIVGQNWQFTPLPNRLDLFSWWGIAQEINILLNYPLSLPLTSQQKLNNLIEQEANWGKIIINTPHCSQIQLVLIKNIKIVPSPQWIKDYLASNNIDPINNSVDIANLVMLETGQPLHIYDYDKLTSKEITIRQALEKEEIIILSGKTFSLSMEDMVISADRQAISLAGVSGSQATAVNNQTVNILIESALFAPYAIKKTSQRLAFSTQASQYFSKKYNLPFGNYALNRAIELVKEIFPGSEKEQVISWTKKQQNKKTITISQEFIEKKLGVKLKSEKLEEILNRLHFPFKKVNKT